MSVGITIVVNENIYQRDPQETKLGKKIIQASIELIDELGFEAFTFKKLADKIESTEASVYRYFENKKQLLIYLLNWYWEWVNYLIEINTRNIDDPWKKLEIIFSNIIYASKENPTISHVNENILHNLVINEGSKAYHQASVDADNEKGEFIAYKTLVSNVADVIQEVNSEFPYRYSLASNFIEMINNQIFFAEHLPRLTDLPQGKKCQDALVEMCYFFARKLLA